MAVDQREGDIACILAWALHDVWFIEACTQEVSTYADFGEGLYRLRDTDPD